MFVQLDVMEQRYQAAMKVLSGMTTVDVAERYGVHRNSVSAWVRRYEEGGLHNLADHSHRLHCQPRQIDTAIEALICELRRAHHR